MYSFGRQKGLLPKNETEELLVCCLRGPPRSEPPLNSSEPPLHPSSLTRLAMFSPSSGSEEEPASPSVSKRPASGSTQATPAVLKRPASGSTQDQVLYSYWQKEGLVNIYIGRRKNKNRLTSIQVNSSITYEKALDIAHTIGATLANSESETLFSLRGNPLALFLPVRWWPMGCLKDPKILLRWSQNDPKMVSDMPQRPHAI